MRQIQKPKKKLLRYWYVRGWVYRAQILYAIDSEFDRVGQKSKQK